MRATERPEATTWRAAWWRATRPAALCRCLGLGLSACGQASPNHRMVGTYATDAVQADLEEQEHAVVSVDLEERLDTLDRTQAQEAGAIWARLRLQCDGHFEYEGPASDDGAADARLKGRWTGRTAFVELVVEQAGGSDVEHLARRLTCPATRRDIELPFLTDPKTRRPLRLARR